MREIPITRGEYEQFKELQLEKHWKFPIVFSTNSRGQIWPFITNGKTPEEKRDYVQGRSDLLDRVASIYTATRDPGGRFFINRSGAFYRTAGLSEPVKLIGWAFDSDSVKPPRTYADLKAQRVRKE